MYFDLPVFKTCCCLSMRHGLTVWGTLKVLFSSFLTVLLSMATISLVRGVITENVTVGYYVECFVVGTALVIAIVDVILNVILVVGCVKYAELLQRVTNITNLLYGVFRLYNKFVPTLHLAVMRGIHYGALQARIGKARLLQKYYWHCKFIVIMILFFCVLNLIASVASMFLMCPDEDMPLRCSVREVLDIMFYFAGAAFHVYILLLVRSEILRLDSLSKSGNNATDTEANLDNKSNIDKHTESKQPGINDKE